MELAARRGKLAFFPTKGLTGHTGPGRKASTGAVEFVRFSPRQLSSALQKKLLKGEFMLERAALPLLNQVHKYHRC